MEILWSPWRSKYIDSFKNENKKEKSSECFICDAIKDNGNDNSNLVVKRFENSIVIMNKYPYNNGHILICPNKHIPELTNLKEIEFNEIHSVLKKSILTIQNTIKPHGYNVGLNIGAAAGAGVPGHLHYHIVPRWLGDTNFISTIADLKMISQSIEETYILIKNSFVD